MTRKNRWGKGLFVTFMGVCGLSQVGFSAGVQAEPASAIWGYLLIGLLALWILSAAAGWIMLLRRGYFANQIDKLAAGREWMGCFVGLLLLMGLWVVAVLPGPFLIWFARTRKPRPQCPQCKNWLPHGATYCVHCDKDIVSGEKITKPDDTVIQAQELIPVDANICEKCGVENALGQKYYFFYGTFTGSEYLGKERTRYDFKIAGSHEVYLCDRCVSEYGRRRMMRRGLWIGGAIAFMAIVFPLLQMSISEGSATQRFPFSLVGLMVLMAAAVFFMFQRQHSKAPLAQGDSLAIELRAPGLRQRGYTRFYTRGQMKSNQLL